MYDSEFEDKVDSKIYKRAKSEITNKKRKLTTKFNKLNKLAIKREELKNQKQLMEEIKDNEILQKYLGILQELDVINKSLEDYKNLYQDMLDTNTDSLEGSHIVIKLKKPYIRKSFDSQKFYKKYSASTKMYKDFIIEKEIEGNVSLILVEE